MSMMMNPPLSTAAKDPVAWYDHRAVLWGAFIVIHLVFWIAAMSTGRGFGDVVTVYKPWAIGALHGTVVGIDTEWVYPIGSLALILLPLLFGTALYTTTWMLLVTIANAGAFFALTRHSHQRTLRAAWWWLAFLALLGMVSAGRVDSFATSLSIAGVVFLARYERVAVILLTCATWIKVWPATILVAMVVALKTRWRTIALAVITSACIIAVPLALGAGWNIASFITAQTDRGIQIEAPFATGWMWQAVFSPHDAVVYFHKGMKTFQVSGTGTELVSSALNGILVLVVITLVVVALRSMRRGYAAQAVLGDLSLALVTAFLAVNKVGSPQYVTWLAAPIIMGILYRGRAYITPALLALVIAALTQGFGFRYAGLVHPEPVAVGILTLRNLAYFLLLGWAVRSLWRAKNDSNPRTTAISGLH